MVSVIHADRADVQASAARVPAGPFLHTCTCIWAHACCLGKEFGKSILCLSLHVTVSPYQLPPCVGTGSGEAPGQSPVNCFRFCSRAATIPELGHAPGLLHRFTLVSVKPKCKLCYRVVQEKTGREGPYRPGVAVERGRTSPGPAAVSGPRLPPWDVPPALGLLMAPTEVGLTRPNHSADLMERVVGQGETNGISELGPFPRGVRAAAGPGNVPVSPQVEFTPLTVPVLPLPAAGL